VLDERQQIGLAARRELGLDLVGLVEMVLDGALVPPGDEHHVLDAGGDGLLDRVLNERLVDDGHHLLRARLGRRQEPAPHPGYREDRLGHFLHASESLKIFSNPSSSMTATPSSRAFSSLLPASVPATT